MRKYLLPFGLAAVIGTAGAAMANTTTATIAAVFPGSGVVTLTDGRTFFLPAGDQEKIESLLPGDRINISWTEVTNGSVATAVQPVN